MLADGTAGGRVERLVHGPRVSANLAAVTFLPDWDEQRAFRVAWHVLSCLPACNQQVRRELQDRRLTIPRWQPNVLLARPRMVETPNVVQTTSGGVALAVFLTQHAIKNSGVNFNIAGR